MKTITNENKAKIYNQYQFSYCCFDGISNTIWTTGVCTVFGYYVINGDYGKIYMDNISPLCLKPLSQITDEEAIEIANILGCESPFIYIRNQHHVEIHSKDINFGIWNDGEILCEDSYIGGYGHPLILHAYQYLQSKGYALPYLNYSVEDLVELGVYKLES